MDNETDPPIYGDVSIRKQRRKRRKLLLVEVFMDFANNTALHGLRYFAKPGLQIIEKIFWFVTFASSIVLSFYFIYNVWSKWKSSPVIVSFSEQHVPVEMVPFPSVTICPQVKFKQSDFNYTEIHRKYRDLLDGSSDEKTSYNYTEEFEISDALTMICDIKNTFTLNKTTDSSAVHHLIRLAPESEEIFVECKRQWGRRRDCTNLFKKVLTKDGVCYNLNGLAADEIFRVENIQHEYKYIFSNESSRNWTLTDGYLNDDRNPYPSRGRDNGGIPDLHLEMFTMEDEKDNVCNGLYTGYKIFLHHPADFPHSSIYYFAALPKQLSSMALRFTMVTTSERLKSYPLETRQCYFPDEKPLRYFVQYTYNNCRVECLSNYTYRKCGCVAFYMPHNNSKEICSANKMSCVDRAQAALAGQKSRHKKNGCFCLPECNSIQYDAEIHKNNYDVANLYANIYKVYLDNDSSSFNPFESFTFSKVDIYFREPMYMSMHRSELFGLTDFLSNCGGLLGLFLGFSFLSLIEIFYFLTFRVFYTFKMDLKKEKGEKPEKQKNIYTVKDE